VKAGRCRYPVPHRLLIAGLMNYVYEGDYAHLIAVEGPAEPEPATSCRSASPPTGLPAQSQICVPESGSFAIELTVGDGAVAGARKAQFDRWRAALPRPLGPMHLSK
jgi:DsbC/DsbD-like thiol-disulfide interchange protein